MLRFLDCFGSRERFEAAQEENAAKAIRSGIIRSQMWSAAPDEPRVQPAFRCLAVQLKPRPCTTRRDGDKIAMKI
jgi:hypothetical protein